MQRSRYLVLPGSMKVVVPYFKSSVMARRLVLYSSSSVMIACSLNTLGR